MSFLFARKMDNNIYVLSDTKINCSEMKDALQTKIGDENLRLLEKYGIVKNVIVNKNICIGSAGFVEHANDLLEYVEDNNIKDINLILNKALEINNKYYNQTDFIVAYADQREKKLYVIKDNEISEKNSCWIGVKDCFDTFQKYKNDENLIKEYYDSSYDKEFNDMYIDKKCFDKVISSGICLDYVGKYFVDCTYSKEGFSYMESLGSYASSEQKLDNGKCINFYDTIENGGCIYITYNFKKNFGVKYFQTNTKIQFEPYLNINGYNHLRFPKEIIE